MEFCFISLFFDRLSDHLPQACFWMLSLIIIGINNFILCNKSESCYYVGDRVVLKLDLVPSYFFMQWKIDEI